jgi:hypothetical protein
MNQNPSEIPTWEERCDDGRFSDMHIVTNADIQGVMQEEIDALRHDLERAMEVNAELATVWIETEKEKPNREEIVLGYWGESYYAECEMRSPRVWHAFGDDSGFAEPPLFWTRSLPVAPKEPTT